MPIARTRYTKNSPTRPKEWVASKLWILAVLPILAIPIENQYRVFGFSLAKLTILPLLLVVLLFYGRRFFSSWNHPVLLSGIAFLAWGAFAEAVHPFSDWEFLTRLLQMFFFAALVATVSSNPVILRHSLVALALVSSLLGLYLIYNFYGSVNVGAAEFKAASQVRYQSFKEMSLQANLNILAYTVGTGAIIALAKLLVTSRTGPRIAWGIIYLSCVIGSFIPLSRGAFLAVVVATAAALSRNPTKWMTTGRVLCGLGIFALTFVFMPAGLTGRLSSLQPGEEVVVGKEDSRAKVFNAALESIPKYWAVGVGSGQYWEVWAKENGFASLTPFGVGVAGPHNGFFTAWIFFGLPGLALLCLVCFVAARHCPSRDNNSWAATALFGLSVLGLLWLPFTHNLYLKEFGLILGLLMGASRGGLPHGIRHAARLTGFSRGPHLSRQLDPLRHRARISRF